VDSFFASSIVVQLIFSETMDVSATSGALSIATNETVLERSIDWSDENKEATFVMEASWLVGKTYKISVSTAATSAAGVPLAAGFEAVFTVGPDPVEVLAHVPEVDAREVGARPFISAQFSKPVDMSNVAQKIKLFLLPGETVDVEVFASSDKLSLGMIPKEPLIPTPSGFYTVDLTEARGVDGAPIAAQTGVWEFSVGNYDGPAGDLSVTIDETPNPLGPSGLNVDGNTITVGGTVEGALPEVALDWVALGVLEEGQIEGIHWSKAVVTGEAWGVTTALTDLTSNTSGSHFFRVMAVDKAGNFVTGETTFFDLDFEKPWVPTPLNGSFPTTHKFKEFNGILEVEEGSTLSVFENDVFLADFPQVMTESTFPLTLPLGALGETASFALTATDAAGNVSDNQTVSIERVPYTCLGAAGGFPVFPESVREDTLTDDDMGKVTVGYHGDLDTWSDTMIVDEDNSSYGIRASLNLEKGTTFYNSLVLAQVDAAILYGCASVSEAKLRYRLSDPCIATTGGTSPCENIEAVALSRAWVSTHATWQQGTSDENWSEPGLTAEDFDGASIVAATLVEDGGAIEFDVTSLWDEWQRGTRENHGLLIRFSGSVDVGRVILFSAEKNGLKPELDLILNEAP